jgi:putative PIN family toxin of toxin-antitoxin system
MTPNVVFDCMILVQAAANAIGEAGRCFAAVEAGFVQLVMSQATRYEAHDVLTRVKVRQKLPSLTDERIAEILDSLDYYALPVEIVPLAMRLPRDPKDEKYLNLAIASDAKYLVSRDNDLLELMLDESFRAMYPTLEILEPASFLQRMTSR